MPSQITQTSDLKLEEMARILDVAAELRGQRTRVTQELNRPVIKADLRRRLLAAARVSGDGVTAEEVDAAIEHYFDTLHAFQQPRRGLATTLAHLYVRRWWLGLFLIFVLCIAGLIVGTALWI